MSSTSTDWTDGSTCSSPRLSARPDLTSMPANAMKRPERRSRVAALFATDEVEAALDLLELMELGWHDCYGDITPSEELVDDMILVSDGLIVGLIGACRLAITDWRDLKVTASDLPSPATRGGQV